MTTAIRSLIDATLKGMEAGRFQDFCLRFLPCFAERFEGVERFGHTAEGKTRPGVPDLIKTAPSGEQLGIECGTEGGYWGPANAVGDLKPFRDLKECLSRLSKPIEIVAISNREIPQSAPNIKTDIYNGLSSETTAKITLIDGAEIGEFLSISIANQRVKSVLKEFFREVYQALEDAEYRQKFCLAEEVARQSAPNARALLDLVNEAVAGGSGQSDPRRYVLERLERISGCRVFSLPAFTGIVRLSVEELRIRHPLGRIWELVGVPKIGKSFLLRQLISSWTDLDIRLFDVPPDGDQSTARDIAAEILRLFLPDDEPTPLTRSELVRRQAMVRAARPTQPSVIVVDGAENIGEPGLRLLSEVIRDIRRDLLDSIGCVFVTNRRLTALTAANEFVQAPRWTAGELHQLLQSELLDPVKPVDEAYMDLLATSSSGHPLVALALAKRYPTMAQLFLSRMERLPTVGDEELSREVRYFLFEELLKDPDSQRFARRLSLVVGRQSLPVLEAIAGVDPPIRTPPRLIVERLERSVLEGDSQVGYIVPLVFSGMLKEEVGEAERLDVYRAVSTALLRPDGLTLHADKIASGALHAALAGDEHMAALWTSLILHVAVQKKLSDEKLRAVVERTKLIPYIPSQKPRTVETAFARLMMQAGFATAYLKLEERDKAAAALRHALDHTQLADTPTDEYLGLRCACAVLLSLYIGESNFSGALDALAGIQDRELACAPNHVRRGAIDAAALLIPHVPWGEPGEKVAGLIMRQISGDDATQRHAVLNLVSGIALRVIADGLGPHDLDRITNHGPLGSVASSFCKGTYFTESDQAAEGFTEHLKAAAAARALGIASGQDWARLHLAFGDAAHKMGDEDAARAAYEETRANAASDSFEQAWSSWRLGLICQSEALLGDAATGFASLKYDESWGRAMGARGALLIKSGADSAGVDCLATVIRAYFFEGIKDVGPAATVALAHAGRLSMRMSGSPIPDEGFPDFETAPYATVLAEAKPSHGPALACLLLSEIQEQLGDQQGARQWLRRGLETDPTEDDLCAMGMLAKKLFAFEAVNTVVDKDLVVRGVGLVFRQEKAGAFPLRKFLSYCLFSEFDSQLEGTGRTDGLSLLANAVEECSRQYSTSAGYWLAEVELRRARIAEHSQQHPSIVARHFKLALENARASENATVMIDAGHKLGFHLYTFSSSIRELAEWQFCVLRGIELDNENFDRFETLGQNLYNRWAGVEYRRLSEHDLQAKKFLRDCAVAMKKAGTEAEQAAPIMLMLLGRLFRHTGPGTEFAEGKSRTVISLLPLLVKETLYQDE